MSDMAAQIDRLNQIIFFLAVTIVFVVGCWLAEDNLRSLERKPRVEYCPLHRIPVTECRDRHKLDGESDGSSPDDGARPLSGRDDNEAPDRPA